MTPPGDRAFWTPPASRMPAPPPRRCLGQRLIVAPGPSGTGSPRRPRGWAAGPCIARTSLRVRPWRPSRRALHASLERSARAYGESPLATPHRTLSALGNPGGVGSLRELRTHAAAACGTLPCGGAHLVRRNRPLTSGSAGRGLVEESEELLHVQVAILPSHDVPPGPMSQKSGTARTPKLVATSSSSSVSISRNTNSVLSRSRTASSARTRSSNLRHRRQNGPPNLMRIGFACDLDSATARFTAADVASGSFVTLRRFRGSSVTRLGT